ncbi:MAG: hypothetical protein FRX49_01684 [Trebouxia sp. A1-2]|nr:MAG: hypothetical protein FRX49_01684 [Trebouxia sp. A1-2]
MPPPHELGQNPLCFCITEGDLMDASYERVEVRVGHEAAEICAMRSAHHDHPPLGNAPHSCSLCRASYLIHHNHLEAQTSGSAQAVLSVCNILANLILARLVANWHAASSANAGMWDSAIATNFIAGVHNHHALLESVGQQTSHDPSTIEH